MPGTVQHASHVLICSTLTTALQVKYYYYLFTEVKLRFGGVLSQGYSGSLNLSPHLEAPCVVHLQGCCQSLFSQCDSCVLGFVSFSSTSFPREIRDLALTS